MTDKSSESGLRNRRFLVSVWHRPHLRSGSESFDTLRGTVWKADPVEPGRIALPESFVGLDALPAILGTLLLEPEDSAPETSGGGT